MYLTLYRLVPSLMAAGLKRFGIVGHGETAASELAENLGVKNLVLYHTEDKNIKKRKELYGAEGREYYHGNLFIPDDMETFEL